MVGYRGFLGFYETHRSPLLPYLPSSYLQPFIRPQVSFRNFWGSWMLVMIFTRVIRMHWKCPQVNSFRLKWLRWLLMSKISWWQLTSTGRCMCGTCTVIRVNTTSIEGKVFLHYLIFHFLKKDWLNRIFNSLRIHMMFY